MVDGRVIRELAAKSAVPAKERNNKEKYPTITNRIIDLLNQSQELHIDSIQAQIKDFNIKGNKDLLEFIKARKNIKYDDQKETFTLVSKHDITSIEALKEKIREKEYGISEAELENSYKNYKEDLKRLKEENQVKWIKNEEKQKDILYYRDKDDPIEKILIDPAKSEALKFIRDAWKEIKAHDNYEDRINYLGEKKLRHQEKKEKRRRARASANGIN